MSKFVCPNCGSENIQKMQIVYQSGTHSTSGQTTYKDERGNKVNAESSENTITALASAVAPPKEKDTPYGAALIFGAIGIYSIYELLRYGFGWGVFIFGGITLLVAWGCYSSATENSEWNRIEYPKLYNEWCSSFICHKCGHRFVIK